MGNADPNKTKAGNKYEVKPHPSQLGGRHSNPVVTTPTIALDFSGTTQQSASHNVAPNQLLDHCPISSSSSDDSMHFDAHDTATTSFSLPAIATPDVTKALAQLRASIEQIRDRDDGAKLKDTLLLQLHDMEKRFTVRFDEQDRVLGVLRKDSHNQKHLLSLDIKSSQKQLSAQTSTAAFDVVDVRREGKDSSSRGPQPPPDDQGRGSGNTGGDNVRTTDILDRFSGIMSREGRVRSCERRSSGNRSGHSKRRRYDSGGTFRRSFEDWLG
ncbi:putative receptor-like protein kinase [Dorcoceras hygrometricum]|uniref:Putative receptor-like protein kinase n=1 Tax=Dorcoceras hygrometricum TaxID=472368 RepID=A0A2Z7CLG7_9LAMI|nr:putative receptor-like protein kinase [Dorcoceras hygrometricum]